MMQNIFFGLIILLAGALAAPRESAASPVGEKDAFPPAAVASAASGKDYLIGPGDVLGLEVWKDPNLTRTMVVLADGKVNVPLIGEINAADRTIADLKKELEKRLTHFIPDPVVTLEVKQCNSLFIYVLGRVNNPGRFAVASSINVLQGLAISGGLNPFAKRDQIKIFRSEHGKTRIIPFHYDQVTQEEQIEDNIELRRGDVIVVP